MPTAPCSPSDVKASGRRVRHNRLSFTMTNLQYLNKTTRIFVKYCRSINSRGNTNAVGQCSFLTTAGCCSWGRAGSIMGVSPKNKHHARFAPPNGEVGSHLMALWNHPLLLGLRTYARCTSVSFLGQDVGLRVPAEKAGTVTKARDKTRHISCSKERARLARLPGSLYLSIRPTAQAPCYPADCLQSTEWQADWTPLSRLYHAAAGVGNQSRWLKI